MVSGACARNDDRKLGGSGRTPCADVTVSGIEDERCGSHCVVPHEATGSGYLVATATAPVLVDFGMFQGCHASEARNPDTR
jgi:hypothetical protein